MKKEKSMTVTIKRYNIPIYLFTETTFFIHHTINLLILTHKSKGCQKFRCVNVRANNASSQIVYEHLEKFCCYLNMCYNQITRTFLINWKSQPNKLLKKVGFSSSSKLLQSCYTCIQEWRKALTEWCGTEYAKQTMSR